MIVIE
jgi:hypothetical protein